MEANLDKINRALRLLECQRKASKSYYERNKEEIKKKSFAYWETHRSAINDRRRERYALRRPVTTPAATAPAPQITEELK